MSAPLLADQIAKLPARSLVQVLRNRIQQSPSRLAARGKKNGAWVQLTWAEVGQRVRDIAAGLIAQGLQPGDRIAILSPTRLEWALVDMAIVSAGAITVPIYASNTADECAFILEDSGAVMAFADSDLPDKGAPGRLSRLAEAKQRLPGLKALFVFDGPTAGAKDLETLEKEGRAWAEKNPGQLEARGDAIEPTSPACFIYTSGTTGNPKGVVLAHYSFVYECVALEQIKLMDSNDTMLLFLPMAHVFGKVAAAAWVQIGFTTAFCDNVEKVLEYAAETRPTVLPAVPRIFEKVYSGVLQKATGAPGIKGKLAAWALREFDTWAEAKMNGREHSSLGLSLAKRLVFKKISALLKDRLGGRIRLCISGSAPLARKIAWFFDFNGLLILEAYGLTENTAGATANRPGQNRIGTVGLPFPNSELKLADDGEILLRGLHVMQGYWKNEAATKEVLTEDGWLKTGDIGEIDADGYVRITDRKKDLIKTSGGKYIAPQALENSLKAASPLISQVMIHGDRRKFVTALVTVGEEPAKALLQERGIAFTNYAELTKQPVIREALQRAFDEVNKGLPSYATIKNFGVLPQELTIESGDLTPSLKVKRKVVTQKYLDVLDGFYGEKLEA